MIVARYETRYADSPGGPVAYQVIGDGGLDVIVAHQPYWPIDLMWEQPALARFLDRLSSFCRHVWFDPRGRGASERLSPWENRIAETVSEDIVAVLDDLGWERAVLLAMGAAVPLMAATHPHRLSALVLVDTTVGRLHELSEFSPDMVNCSLAERRERWGTESLTDLLAPTMAGDGRFRAWLARATRLTCSPELATSRALSLVETDLRPILPTIRVPTLVIDRRGVSGMTV